MIKRIARHTSLLSTALNPWAAANLRLVFSAMAICIVLCSASATKAEDITQQPRTRADVKTTPRITATPDRVKIRNGSASVDIAWNTDNGSMGFVFVTASGRPPVPVATGAEGSRVISWIQEGTYVFELYREAERRTLLASVTVSGVVEPGKRPHARFSQRHLQWLLVVALLAVLYMAIYSSSAGPVRTKFPTEPSSSPQPLHVARNLLLGLAAFICVDAAVFHSHLYTSILSPDSYAGRMAAITRAEKDRAPSGLKEILVLGDSRIAEGFSAAVADNLSSPKGLKFVNLAEPASSVSIWDYMLRDVDPTRHRYWAVVVPYGIGYEPNSADRLRISMAAPLLRYADCFNFASGFRRWSGRCRAFMACILRGSAFQSDFIDFLEHPIARVRSLEREPKRFESRDLYKGRDYDIVGTSYDSKTGQITFPPRLTEAQREAIRDSLVKPSQSEIQNFLKMQRDGIQRILNRYSASSTEIVLTPVPRGPFAGFPGASMTFHAVFPIVAAQKTVFSVPEQTFDFLEKPEYYFDGFHLNAKGRQQFTQTLVGELLGRLRSASSDGHVRANASLTTHPSGVDCPDPGSFGGDGLSNRLIDEVE